MERRGATGTFLLDRELRSRQCECLPAVAAHPHGFGFGRVGNGRRGIQAKPGDQGGRRQTKAHENDFGVLHGKVFRRVRIEVKGLF